MNFVVVEYINFIIIIEKKKKSVHLWHLSLGFPKGIVSHCHWMTDAEDNITVQIHGSLDVYCLVISCYIYFHLFV